MPIPILIDTDIGTDIDDAYALVFAAASPELDLRAVTTVNNDTILRSRIARKILNDLGRADVPVAVGESAALTPGVNRGWHGEEGLGIDLTSISLAADIDPRPAPRVIADEAKRAAEAGTPLILIPIGAMTNVAVALRDYPAEMAAVGRIVAMGSNFAGFGKENARGEHNVACDTDAFQRVLESGIPITLVGLNVTRETAMTFEDLARIQTIGGPLGCDLAGMHRVWFDHIGRDRSAMHDALAVAAAFDDSLMTWQSARGSVLDGALEPGAVEFNPARPGEVTNVRVADSVNTNAFHRLFFARVENAVALSRQSAMDSLPS